MTKQLIPIIVRIHRKVAAGGASNAYPDFNAIPLSTRKGMDWSSYIDIQGGCWHYDQTEPFGEGVNPNEHLGMFCVPEDFATSALDLFGPQGTLEPNRVYRPSNTEAMSFYDEKCHANDPEFSNDTAVLQAIAARRALQIADGPDEIAALDPNHARAGIRKNSEKTFMDHCTKRGFVLKADS